jgi:hypothetical protein
MMTWPDGRDSALPHPRHPDMPSPRDHEPRRRRKLESDREKDGIETSTSSREKVPRSSHKSSSSTKLPLRKPRSGSNERELERDSPRPATSSERAASGQTPVKGKKTRTPIPEMDRRTSGSYPSFSKAHSRESVRELPAEIPEVERDDQKRRHSTPAAAGATLRAPPSPPLTADEPDIRRPGSGGSLRQAAREVKTKAEDGRRSADSTRRREKKTHGTRSGTNLQKEARFAESEVSSMPGAFPEDERKSTPNSSYRRRLRRKGSPREGRIMTPVRMSTRRHRMEIHDQRRLLRSMPQLRMCESPQ